MTPTETHHSNMAAMLDPQTDGADKQGNPLLQPWTTAHELPPFEALRPEHFAPAFHAGMQAHRQELDAIARNPTAPTFDNTVKAFDGAGRLVRRIEMTFDNLAASQTSPALQAVQLAMAQPLAAHANAVYMHAGLFKRLDVLHQARSTLGLACWNGMSR